MSWDLMSILHSALSWAGGSNVGKNAHADGNAQAGAGQLHGTSSAHDILGGMVGGFGGPMDWKGLGFGAQGAGQLNTNGGAHLGGNAGLGAGAGYSQWSMMDHGARLDGTSVAAGAAAPVGFNAGTKHFGVDGSTNFYSGLGGSAYQYNGPGGHGVGLRGNAVGLGAADTNVGLHSPIGDLTGHADNLYAGKASVSSTFGQTASGAYQGSSNASILAGAEGVNGRLATPIGTWSGGADKATYGVSGGLSGGYDPKTHQADLGGNFNAGLNAKNVHTGYSTPGGAFQQNANADVFYGVKGDGSFHYDPKKGVDGTFSGEGGGFNVSNAHADGKLRGVGSYSADLGEISNTTQITDGKFHADGNSTSISGSADGMGLRIMNGKFGGQLGSGPNAVNASASFGAIGSDNTLTGASLTADYHDWKNPSLAAHAKYLSYAGWTGSDMHAKVTGPGGFGANADLGSFGMNQFQLNDADVKANRDGVTAHVGDASYAGNLHLADAHTKIGTKDIYQSADLGEFGMNKAAVKNLNADASWDPRKGAHLSADSASYDQVLLKDVAADTHLGNAYQSHIGLGEGTFNHFDAKNIHAGLDMKTGLTAGLTDGHYSYLGGKNIDISQKIAGGALGASAHIGSANALGVDVGKLDYSNTLMNQHLAIQNLGAHGLTSSDVTAKTNIGALGAGAHADKLNLLDLNVGEANLDTHKFGTQGSASIKNASLDAVNVQGANAGLSWGGKEFLGAGGDYRAGAGLGSANADWNLLGGTANANFKDASVGGQLNNAHVNLFGHNFNLPNMGAKLNASGGANVDLAHGAANANLSLAGSNVNFGGASFTVPQWVQASAGMNLSQGAVNANLGGAHGVGADVNLAKGQFDVNLFGHHLDVAQGVHDVGSGIANTASAVGSGISNAASSVGHAASDAFHAVTSW